ncbi:fungal-specific transcription factor domain-containing protein [Pseudomassariella vexata]|uniref:Fungal-specific transcription factor domain-domain-containing protein n=1 Tax=Pseudomassariella vexata TaxID=1141098 RepID=A0A1Y2E3F9_9PEZI|nr:fungal-specific transcription factor domain-containing protein [Pseudomassariella vexata]ORY66049.1 fungal-specific transcription factor domain-domain-containing protein [Pseudomassariella vexata]
MHHQDVACQGGGKPDTDDRNASSNSGPDETSRSKRRRLSKEDQQENEGPACQNCRRKKSACSRTQPCSACTRYHVDCVYDDRRMKPGLRTGAIESLSQRVVALEQMFLGQGLLWQQMWQTQQAAATNGRTEEPNPVTTINDELQGSIARLRGSLAATSNRESGPSFESDNRRHGRDPPRSRETRDQAFNISALDETVLPPDDLVDALVDIYFANVHPWIPMLHVRQFRERMANPTERQTLSTIFYAIISLCVRFSDDQRLGDADQKTRYAKRSRQLVILRSMESFSVENLQALTICAFDLIGGGRGPSAWSIVGSMTRTVVQLQLSVEDDDQVQGPAKTLIKRMAFLPKCRNWSETEERRRVFWNIFIMDRFCSIATGWNFSLTSADVKRRLPCEGALWETGQPLEMPTPFFGVADESSRANPTVPTIRPEVDDQSLGGFAFSIEATESLSLVTSFFLQQDIPSDPRQVQVWLMRFKQLDLRLIQWKIFLPERWREACVLNSDGNMDPNLTLAHMTHNTAVILLHQVIAFPLPEWRDARIRLPSSSSSETCLAAATEVAIIADAFLQRSSSLTNPQFSFCLFIAGRMLLAYSSYKGEPLASAFDSLVNSLLETSRRWNGLSDISNETPNLASKFASRLVEARQQGRNILDIRKPVYSDDQYLENTPENSLDALPNFGHNATGTQYMSISTPPETQDASPDSISMAFPPLPLAFQGQPSFTNPSTPTPSQVVLPNHLAPGTQISNMGLVPDPMIGEAAANGYDSIDGFLDNSFPPDQRISVFSYRNV